ncbi:uncharacterized protein F5891DRAFT_1063366 [Suillus fuscotomentosus]|uniref:RING-type domain-containing protein n=1 Tax=Suillus fuscotomentosus TaxID=1912939 RepID=A0AAD4DUJ8_9AGAM|nr:uncharacterized protein F5891DRAFT_1063366 [Suillus fuscotomentosus]KAG1894122.1 hypothetical protein F5891DRAFT_1063366 [Suillus fuscotomentosus]
MTTKRKNSDTIDLTTSSTLSTPLPAPSTSRNRLPRSATSSRSSSQASRSQSGGPRPNEDTTLLPDHAEEDLSHHRRKRRRIDFGGEEQINVHQPHEDEAHPSLLSNPPDNNVLEASTSSQVASSSLLSSWNMAPDLMLGSSSLDEELVDQPPLTQESVASQAYSDAADAGTEVDIMDQRGTSQSASEITNVPPDDVVLVSPTLSPRRTQPSLRPIVIDDPIPLEMTGTFTPEPASQDPHAFPLNATSSSSSAPELLSAYTCPICFSPPTNATLTPCGHICCGACLFAAVKSTVKRNMVIAMDRAPVPRCPVCRAEIPGWDGRGGGVVGLKVEVVYSL